MFHPTRIVGATTAWRAASTGLRAILLALGVAALGPAHGLASAVSFYVTPNGSDSNPGTIDQPFATLEKARDTLRSLQPLAEGATVFVRGGTYYRTNTFSLGPADSGQSTNAPVVFAAYPDEHPLLIGGLPITNFVPWNGEIMKADVAAQGFTGIYFRQLFFDGHRQHLARYPNFEPTDPYGAGWAYVDNSTRVSSSSFTYQTGDMPHTWANPTNAEVFIFAKHDWWNNIVPVSSIDTSNRVIHLNGSTDYPIYPGDRYYVRNVFEELDAPGEWYLDNRTWTLYFWPPYPIEDQPVYAPVIRTLISLSTGTSNVQVRGFDLECTEGTAVNLAGTTNCLVAANTIFNVGDYNGSGIQIAAGFNNGAAGNDISQVGRHGIQISGGVTQTLTPAKNYADNNYIHHVGIFYKQGSGIWLTGVGNRATHNLVHDGPRFGIRFEGEDHLVEYNEFRNVMLETDDGGIIYCYTADWLGQRGSVVRYNYAHDADGWGFFSGTRTVPSETYGIYLDGLSCGVDVVGNIITRTSGSGIFVNGGSYNNVSNNIIINCLHPLGGAMHYSPQLHIVGYPTNNSTWIACLPTFNRNYYSVYSQPAWSRMRGLDMAPTNYSFGAAGYTMQSNLFFDNIVVYTNTSQAPWAYYFYNVGFDRNKFDNNVLYHYGATVVPAYTNSSQVTLAQWNGMGEDVHSATTDPLISSVSTGDYTLRTNSPALSLGFQQIPVGQIGPYLDPLRPSWPILQAPGAREGFSAPTPPADLHVVN